MLGELLGELPVDQIVAFDSAFRRHHSRAYTWDLWGAAYLIGGGCSDDGFADFRGWLISQGESAYDAALADPESLAPLAKRYECDCQVEGFQYLGMAAWAKKTGGTLNDFPTEKIEHEATPAEASGDPAGESWEEDELCGRYPALCKIAIECGRWSAEPDEAPKEAPSAPELARPKSGSVASIVTYEEVPFALVRATLDRHRIAFGKSHIFPFIVGDDEDRARFEEMIDPPADGGRAAIEAAKQVDISQWLKGREPSAPLGSWPATQTPQSNIQSLFNILTRKPKEKIYLGFVEVENSWEALAALGYGGWNDCPEPHIHVALHQYWNSRFGSSPVAISGDVVECYVPKPPLEVSSAMELAAEQYAYCGDIVDQGTETVSNLGAILVRAPFWYFWWD